MKHPVRSVLTLLLSVSLVIGLMPAFAFADEPANPITASGTYHFTSNERETIQLEDEFEFRESCFTRSGFLGCNHLAELSARVAIASASYIGPDDVYSRDNSQDFKNAIELLQAMGFEDVEGNAYSQEEMLENSAGCVVGRMTIQDGSETYTLLAVVPRSANYKQEWAGNFTVGTEGMHEGFKAARDEVLRFVKQYIGAHSISGNLKVWTMGHSRGAGVANALGGFFAEGGAGYFDGVTIAPEDVYCYSYATPKPIVAEGATKAQVLSVAGARGGEYADDTPGEAYTYNESDASETISPHEGVYGCIHNCAPDYDLITLLPPELWGFTWYGVDLSIDGDGATKEAMLTELEGISEYAYVRYLDGGDESDYRWKTLDLDLLKLVDDESCTDAITQADMFAQRMAGLVYNAQTRQAYVENGYQDTLVALAGIYGMEKFDFFPGILDDTATAIKAVAFSYLAYASERLQAENGDMDETDAITIAIAELLEFATGEKIDPSTYTINDLLATLAIYVTDKANATYEEDSNLPLTLEFTSKTVEMLNGMLGDLLVDKAADYMWVFGISDFDEMDDAQKKDAADRAAFMLMNIMAYGSSGTKENHEDPNDAEEMREGMMAIVAMLLGESYPDIAELIVPSNEEDPSTGDYIYVWNKASDLIEAVLPLLMTYTDSEGTETTYETVAEAADAYLAMAIDNGMNEALGSGAYDVGTTAYNDLAGHGQTLKAHTTQLRRLIMYALFYTDGEPFNTQSNIRNACTFISQTAKIELAHYNEVYVAWMAAKDMTEHEIVYSTTEGDGGEWTKGSTATLNFRFSRSEEDAKAFRHFIGIEVDGAVVAASGYTAESGSVIVKLAPSYLETLATGEHKLTALFDDGNDPQATFTITAKNEPVNPDPEPPENDPTKSDSTPVPGGGPGKTQPSKAPSMGDETPLPFLVATLVAAGAALAISRRKVQD